MSEIKTMLQEHADIIAERDRKIEETKQQITDE
jgi:hypothetical protein